MLCAVCISMFQKDEKHGNHHKTYDDLAKAAANGCKICHSIQHIKNQLSPSSGIYYTFEWHNGWRGHWSLGFAGEATARPSIIVFVHVSNATSPSGYDQVLKSVNDDLVRDPSRVRRDIPALRDIPDNTGHEKVAEIANGWFQACMERHTCHEEHGTQEPGWYPNRLIHIGETETQPRLILRGDSPEGSYAALSHCWGENPQFLRLTSENIEDFRKAIPLEELAASFRDAIITCRRLGIPYIWIDSLCILQAGPGSQEDWLLHSVEMHKVYQNCELNIAFHDAANPEEGAFRERETDLLQDCYVWTPFHKPPRESPWYLDEDGNIVMGQSFGKDFGPEDGEDTGNATITASHSSPGKTQLCAIFTEADFSYSRRHLPLSSRAWVLQEKLLSRRTLHFQADRIAWECHKKPFLTEYLPDSMASQQWEGFDCLFQSRYNIGSQLMTDQTFFDYVMEYTSAQLSHPDEDKLVAFAAIARRFGETWGNTYCAGMFRQWLPRVLLWETTLIHNPTRAERYRAPSCSWASIDGRVVVGVISDGEVTDLVTVQDVQVQLVDPLNPYGQVESASLVLTGPMVGWGSLVRHTAQDEESDEDGKRPRPSGDEYTRLVDEAFTLTTLSDEHIELRPDHFPQIDRDLIKTCIGSTKEVYFIAVSEMVSTPRLESWSGCYGLVLRRREDGVYERLGLWKAKVGFLGRQVGQCAFQEETVTVV